MIGTYKQSMIKSATFHLMFKMLTFGIFSNKQKYSELYLSFFRTLNTGLKNAQITHPIVLLDSIVGLGGWRMGSI